MPLPEPQFDSRTYSEILNDALARIPVHNPEWTNFNDSDPGVTLLQLFAFMTENLLYRANRIPERNRQKFLRLLGVEMQGAEAARGFVTLQNPKGPLEPKTVLDDLEVRAGKVPFRTQNGLTVLPIEARIYYKQRLTGDRLEDAKRIYEQLYASYAQPTTTFDYYETKVFEVPEAGSQLPSIDISNDATDAIDGLWLALFARQGDDVEEVRSKIANQVLTLGILPALDENGCVIYPVGLEENTDSAGLLFETPNGSSQTPAYERLTASNDGDPLREPSIVELSLGDEDRLQYWSDLDPLEAGIGAYPPTLEDDADRSRLITWIRMRLPRDATAAGTVSVKLSWIGVNVAKVVQRARVPAESLGVGTGEPDQTVRVTNTPVLLESVRLTVSGEEWTRIDDLLSAGPEVPTRGPRLASDLVSTSQATTGGSCCGESSAVYQQVTEAIQELPTKVYLLDRESGEIRFGDGAHGMRPPKGAVIQVSYDYGGGRQGVVGIGAITKGVNLQADLKVSNPVPTYGGAEGETIADAEKRVPAYLQHRDRLVAEVDFEEITWRTPGVELGRVEVLSLYHDDQPNQPSPGVVTVLVIPKNDPLHPNAPEPDRLFLQTICEYLSPRRLITTELHVRGPEYVDIWISIAIEVVPGRQQGPVREAARQEIERFLSPLEGGFEENGWTLQKSVDAAEISAAAARTSGVAKVSQILLGDESGTRTEPLALNGLDLPRVMAVSVTSDGDPVTIEELRGETVSETDDPNSLPVPVVPESC